MRVLGMLILPVAAVVFSAPASAGEALPDSGSAKLAAYQVCRPLAAVDMGNAGSDAATECNGIVKNLDSQKTPDNLSIHCLETTSSRPDGYKYSGACVQTDSDGDKLYMTYAGAGTGEVKWAGGTGKYQGVSGAGALRVDVAPGGTPTQFAYTLSFDVEWTRKPK